MYMYNVSVAMIQLQPTNLLRNGFKSVKMKSQACSYDPFYLSMCGMDAGKLTASINGY